MVRVVRRILAVGFCALAVPALAAKSVDSLKRGKAELSSAGVLAFGPEGILFVADSLGGAVYALDTDDRQPASSPKALEVKGVAEQVAARLGTAADQILINDLAVNPLSHRAYLSVSRGRGPDAKPVLLRMDDTGKLEELSLTSIRHAKVSLPSLPPPDALDFFKRPTRMDAVTDIAYADGTLYIAGLSNEEFASKLRTVKFPFQEADSGVSVEIYHGSHGRFETNAPVRTLVTYPIKNELNVLAAYTCTPLVKFPVSSLKPGAKVMGTTIAELGNRNRPLDMISYKKDGKDFLLMANSSRGVMKMSTEKLESIEGITARVPETAGLPFETIADLKGIQQLDRYDDGHALVLASGENGGVDLKTIALP